MTVQQPTPAELEVAHGWPQETTLRMMRMGILPRLEVESEVRTTKEAVDHLLSRRAYVTDLVNKDITWQQAHSG